MSRLTITLNEARYRALGVELQRSDRCGAWVWQASGSALCHRQAAARYWHHRADADVGAGAVP